MKYEYAHFELAKESQKAENPGARMLKLMNDAGEEGWELDLPTLFVTGTCYGKRAIR